MPNTVEMSQKTEKSETQNKDLGYYLSLRYPIEIVEDDGAIVASIPDLPGCASYGDTIDEAVKSVNETKELWIKGRLDGHLSIPEPTDLDDFSGKFVLRIPRGLHRSLDREAKQQGVSLNQYVGHILSERHKDASWKPLLQAAISELTHRLGGAQGGQVCTWAEHSEPSSVQIRLTGRPITHTDAVSMVGFLRMPPKQIHCLLRLSDGKGYRYGAKRT